MGIRPIDLHVHLQGAFTRVTPPLPPGQHASRFVLLTDGDNLRDPLVITDAPAVGVYVVVILNMARE